MRIEKTVEKISDLRQGTYIEDCNVYAKLWENALVVIDLTNSMKRGKNCLVAQVKVKDDPFGSDAWSHIYEYTWRNKLTVKELMEQALTDTIADSDLEVTLSERKGVRTFSPWAKVNKVKKAPRKWTLAHLTKAIVSGQAIDAKQEMRLTDDYAYDNSVNFGKGSISALALAKELVEEPSGWWVHVDEQTDDTVTLSVNCHHFDYNTVTLKLA